MPNELREALHRMYPGEHPDFNAYDFIFARGSAVVTLMYGYLLWPEFVEIDDMVFWRGVVHDDEGERRVHGVLAQYDGDRERTERDFNFIEVPELFGGESEEVSNAIYEELTRLLCDTWRSRLADLFPGKSFVIELVPANETTGELVGIWFYQPTS